MSSINQKGPKFRPLNQRKFESENKTVGQNYGERLERQKTQKSDSGGFLQRVRDTFAGSKKAKDVDRFTNYGDKYQSSSAYADSASKQNRQIEKGTYSQTGKPTGPADQHLTFLNAAINFLSQPKK
ncbi:MAG: hypothetical protein Q7S68_05195 [Deltaproteobacteria bacterium]|nr:hypothetical protein [Deltaproteobacteria bacterium]